MLVVFYTFIFTVVSYANCVDSNCHLNFTKLKFLHGPVAANQCMVCHLASDKDVKKHASKPKSFVDFTLPKEKPLCVVCHDTKYNGKYIHNPVESGECLSCHNPHGGNNKFFLKGDKESDTCFQCHENNKMVKTFLHGPLGIGECASCHNPHSSDNKFQLKLNGNDLCFNCHNDKKDLLKKSSVHKPFEKSCLECHDPHNSDTKFHLKAVSEKEQCIACHKTTNKDVIDNILNAKYQHKPVKDDKCGTCHNPHATDNKKLLLSNIKTICFECHKNVAEKVNKSKFVHGPVKSDGCYACHSTHGSNNPYLLVKYFPKEFYNDYKEGLYDICFNCHNESAMKVKITTQDTGFRNGSINLHYLHVQVKGKGRSCKACHEVHAGNQDLHIRESVPFGSSGWELPIKFTKKVNGGSCVVGCHKPKTYDRVKEYYNN